MEKKTFRKRSLSALMFLVLSIILVTTQIHETYGIFEPRYIDVWLASERTYWKWIDPVRDFPETPYCHWRFENMHVWGHGYDVHFWVHPSSVKVELYVSGYAQGPWNIRVRYWYFPDVINYPPSGWSWHAGFPDTWNWYLNVYVKFDLPCDGGHYRLKYTIYPCPATNSDPDVWDLPKVAWGQPWRMPRYPDPSAQPVRYSL